VAGAGDLDPLAEFGLPVVVFMEQLDVVVDDLIVVPLDVGLSIR
jgi:hypothetical protein